MSLDHSDGAPDSATDRLTERPPGVHMERLRDAGGAVRRFTISVPQGYPSGTPSPLVTALHYGGEVTPHYGRGVLESLVEPALRELRPIIIAPDSIAGRWTNETNEGYVLRLIDRVSAAYRVNAAKTLLTGFSLGGEGTWYIGGRNQNCFRAVIPIAGTPTSDATWTIPMRVIHARRDEIVPLAPVQSRVDALRSEGVDVTLIVLDGITHFETHRFADSLRESVPWIRKAWGE